jgi:hypothetical protein
MTNVTSTLMSLIPILIAVGVMLLIVSMFFGGGSDYDGVCYRGFFRRYWWLIALFGLPLILILGLGVDWVFIIGILVMGTIVGAVILFWSENDFELPKGDPIKKGIRWLRENFRW